jgi:hypothetical protein
MGPICNPRSEQKRTEGYVIVSKHILVFQNMPALSLPSFGSSPARNSTTAKKVTLNFKIFTSFIIMAILVNGAGGAS